MKEHINNNWVWASSKLEIIDYVRFDLADASSLEDCIDTYITRNVFNRSMYGSNGSDYLNNVYFYQLDENGDIKREIYSLTEARRLLKIEEL